MWLYEEKGLNIFGDGLLLPLQSSFWSPIIVQLLFFSFLFLGICCTFWGFTPISMAQTHETFCPLLLGGWTMTSIMDHRKRFIWYKTCVKHPRALRERVNQDSCHNMEAIDWLRLYHFCVCLPPCLAIQRLSSWRATRDGRRPPSRRIFWSGFGTCLYGRASTRRRRLCSARGSQNCIYGGSRTFRSIPGLVRLCPA